MSDNYSLYHKIDALMFNIDKMIFQYFFKLPYTFLGIEP